MNVRMVDVVEIATAKWSFIDMTSSDGANDD